MTQKIIDISPPGKINKEISERLPEAKNKKIFLKFLIGILVISGMVLGVYFTSGFYSKLTLYLVPETKSESFEIEVEVNVSQDKVDLRENIIPGRFFETEKEKWQTFESTGKDFLEIKAKGVVKVYNSHTPPRAVALRASTRFLSAEGGKIFRTPEKIYLPPAKISGGKTIPSFKEVQVIAQEAGEEYNIGPSKFSVPGLAGTSLYYTIWAESEDPMTGGLRKEIKKVSEDDLKNAKSILRENLKKLAENSLKNKLSPDFVIAPGASFVENFQSSCLAKAGDEKNQFNCEGKIKIGALAFKLSDLKEIAKNHILSNIPSLKDFDPQSMALEYKSENLLKEDGKMILFLTIKVNIYDKISEEIVKGRVRGKSEKEIRDALNKSYPQIKKMKFDFWPFWVKKAPASQERIKVLVVPSYQN